MLSDTKIKTLKPKDRLYRVADRDGLYLAVTRTGVKSFRYNYKIDGRQETITFGQYPEAREMLLQAKKVLASGRSPAREKKAAAIGRKAEDTIEAGIGEWIEKAQMAE